MSVRYRVVASVCICSAVLAGAAGIALGYIGTTQGRKLAAELLHSYSHTRHLAGSVHGAVYYCPSDPNALGGYDEEVGGRPPSSCANHPARASWVETLSSRGTGASVVGTVTAQNRPTITFVGETSATFIKARGAHCWTKQIADYNFIGIPPFGFFPKEYMSVGAKHGNRIQLLGRMKDFHEVDTLNATNHQMIGESIFFSHDHLITSYHTTDRAPAVPGTTPVC